MITCIWKDRSRASHLDADSAFLRAARVPGMLRKEGGDSVVRKAIVFPEAGESFSRTHVDPVQVAQYRIMRRQGNGDFALLKAIAPGELQNNQFRMQDKYLEKTTLYTYRIEAYNAAGQLIGYLRGEDHMRGGKK